MTFSAQQSPWGGILHVWHSGQVGLPGVVRWSKYLTAEGASVRRQDSLQHSYSIAVLGMIICYRLYHCVVLDEMLIHRALLIHDHGEGELGYDTLYINKAESGDLAEYHAFVGRYSMLPPALFHEFRRAFLLQFALKCPASFPEEAREAMMELAQRNRADCLVFDAIERLDYVLYAWEQQIVLGNDQILVQVLRNQVPHLDRLTQELPGFGQEVWTPDLRAYFQQFLTAHEGKWVEQRG